MIDFLCKLFLKHNKLKRRVAALEERMSAVDDRITAFTKAVDEEIARIQATNDAHAAELDKLKADVSGGVLTPAQQKALDDAQAKIDAADLTNPATLPPPAGTDTTPGGAGTDTTAGGAGPAP